MRRRKTVELILEDIYGKYHKRQFVEPDPIQFLYSYEQVKDREIVGLIASSLALGRVSAILDIIEKVLSQLPSPYENLINWTEQEIRNRFKFFLYRFYRADDLVSLLLGIREVIREKGSLNNCILEGYSNKDSNILPGLTYLIQALNQRGKIKMLADPEKNSACKRHMLYLRWMLRNDGIDPGGWSGIPSSKLIIPLDTHMLKVASILKLTSRKDGSIKTAVDITETLRKYDCHDPVRFDFSLTRPGIHPELDYSEFNS